MFARKSNVAIFLHIFHVLTEKYKQVICKLLVGFVGFVGWNLVSPIGRIRICTRKKESVTLNGYYFSYRLRYPFFFFSKSLSLKVRSSYFEQMNERTKYEEKDERTK